MLMRKGSAEPVIVTQTPGRAAPVAMIERLTELSATLLCMRTTRSGFASTQIQADKSSLSEPSEEEGFCPDSVFSFLAASWLGIDGRTANGPWLHCALAKTASISAAVMIHSSL
jgi:hypothetical protein